MTATASTKHGIVRSLGQAILVGCRSCTGIKRALVVLLLVGFLVPAFAPVAEGLSGATPPPGAHFTRTPRTLMERVRTLVLASDSESLAALIDWPRGRPRSERLLASEHFVKIFDRYAEVTMTAVSDSPTGETFDQDDPSLETSGYLVKGRVREPIVLKNTATDGNSGDWRITSQTIDAAASFKLESLGLVSSLIASYPDTAWLEATVAGLALWQWLGILITLLVSIAAGKGLAWFAEDLVHRRMAAHGQWPFTAGRHGLVFPLAVILAVTVFRLGMPYLGLSIAVREDLVTASRMVQIVAVVALLFKLTNMAFATYDSILRRRDRAGATALLPPLRKGVKVLLALGGSLALLTALGFDVSALLAGLGVGGLAVALAGQKTLENLFGGVTIVLDQPVRVGEFGRFGSVQGTVEDIGLRSTRIRTLDRTVVTIPNGEFSQLHIETFAVRDKMRFYALLGVRYETTPAQMVRLCDALRALLAEHPLVLPDPRRVRFLNLGSSALEIEIFAYIGTPDFDVYLGVREALNLRILDIIAEVGTECAFQSSTSYHGTLSVLPAEKIKDAETYRRDREAAASQTRGPNP